MDIKPVSVDISKPHQEQVNAFLEKQGLSWEQALVMTPSQRHELDTAFRAARNAAYGLHFNDAQAIKISRAEMKRMLPVGTKLTLVYAMGSMSQKPRTVAEHKSYGFEMRTPEGKLSSIRFEAKETVWLSGAILTVRDYNNVVLLRYELEAGQ